MVPSRQQRRPFYRFLFLAFALTSLNFIVHRYLSFSFDRDSDIDTNVNAPPRSGNSTVGHKHTHNIENNSGERKLPLLSAQSDVVTIVGNPYTISRRETPFGDDYIWSRYCKLNSPCIALLSASHHEGINSLVDPRTLLKSATYDSDVKNKKKAATSLHNRILVREGYCAIYNCDVIIDFNAYNTNQTMWLSDHGKHKVGPMPPHWNKVAAIRRWLPLFDAVLWMDVDTTWIDFNTSVYELLEATPTIYSNGSPGLILFRKGEMSRCVVDSWWYYGTSPGCRYFKYPENHRTQTQNLDMPWFWYAMLKCSELYRGGEPYECLNQCNGPENYVSRLEEDPNYKALQKLWPGTCFEENKSDIRKYTNVTLSPWFYSKHLCFNMQFGSMYGMSFSESFGCSISVHLKDSDEMLNWLNKTAEVLLRLGCQKDTCRNADTASVYQKLRDWSGGRERSDYWCIEKYYG